jgi:hypothetical protein
LNLQLFQHRSGNGSTREYLLYEEINKTISQILFQLGNTKFDPGEVIKSVDFLVTNIRDLQGRKFVIFIMTSAIYGSV